MSLSGERKEERIQRILVLSPNDSISSLVYTFFKQIKLLFPSRLKVNYKHPYEDNEDESLYIGFNNLERLNYRNDIYHVIQSQVIYQYKRQLYPENEAQRFALDIELLSSFIDPNVTRIANIQLRNELLCSTNLPTALTEIILLYYYSIPHTLATLWKCLPRLNHDPIACTAQYKFVDYMMKDDNFNRLCALNYVPNDEDVLRVPYLFANSYNKIATGVYSLEFELKDNESRVYELVFPAQNNEMKKWLHMFDNVAGLILLIDITQYNQLLYSDEFPCVLVQSLLFLSSMSNGVLSALPQAILMDQGEDFESLIMNCPLKEYWPSYEGGNNVESAHKYWINNVAQDYRHERKTKMKHNRHKLERKGQKQCIQILNLLDRDQVRQCFSRALQYFTDQICSND